MRTKQILHFYGLHGTLVHGKEEKKMSLRDFRRNRTLSETSPSVRREERSYRTEVLGYVELHYLQISNSRGQQWKHGSKSS